jgi:hypothetical protein
MSAILKGGISLRGVSISQIGLGPVIPAIFLYDTFTGSAGAFSGHVGEINAAWSEAWAGSMNVLALNGAGGVTSSAIGNGSAKVNAPGVPYNGTLDYHVTGSINVSSTTFLTSGGGVGASCTTDATSWGINVSTFAQPDSGHFMGSFGINYADDSGGLYIDTPPMPFNVPFTWKIVVTNNQLTYEFFINDVSQGSITALSAMSPIDQINFGCGAVAADSIGVITIGPIEGFNS